MPLPDPASLAAERALLHCGGPLTGWHNLGLWSATPSTSAFAAAHAVRTSPYARACQALADEVARAAGMCAGDQVLSLACGTGEEIQHWRQAHGCAQVVGIDAQPPRLPPANALDAVFMEQISSSQELLARWPGSAAFDRVVCVDAAYHLSPRLAWWRAARTLVRPGGGLAFTDLVLPAPSSRTAAARRLLQAPAGWSGIALDEVLDTEAALQRIELAGWVSAQATDLTIPVLVGFERFVRSHGRLLGRSAWSPHWRRVRATAALMPLARAAGLRYVLFSARAPLALTPPSNG
jgi:SAM-dependent methyltransferase